MAESRVSLRFRSGQAPAGRIGSVLSETEMAETERAAKSAQVEEQPTPGTQLERLIAVTLLAGVLASTFIVFVGGVVYLWRHGTSTVDYRAFHGEPSNLLSLQGIRKEVIAFSGQGIIQFGLMLLVGLQVVRVALAGVYFLASRDRVFVAFTGIVLALLAYGLMFEAAGAR